AAYGQGMGPPVFEMPSVSGQDELSIADVGIAGLDLSGDDAASRSLGKNELNECVVPDVIFLMDGIKDGIGGRSHLRYVVDPQRCCATGALPFRGHRSDFLASKVERS